MECVEWNYEMTCVLINVNYVNVHAGFMLMQILTCYVSWENFFDYLSYWENLLDFHKDM